MAKKELSISEFREIIKEEALKLKKRIVLENEKKALQNELKSLIGESFLGEETLEEVSFDEAAHEDAIRFLASDPRAEQVKSMYQAFKDGDREAGKKLASFSKGYAEKTLGYIMPKSGDFFRDLSRVLDDEISRAVNAQTGYSGV